MKRIDLARLITTKTFGLWETLGFHIVPTHYYEPIPDTRTIPNSLWTAPRTVCGVEMREGEQRELLDRLASTYRAEYENFPRSRTSNGDFFLNNGRFESVDAELLYCMVRHLKPRKIIEVGSGFSTLVSAQAIRKNKEEDAHCDLIAIEPYPSDRLKRLFPSVGRLIRSNVEDVELSEFESLGDHDILFIDSSHVVRIGGDVCRELLDIVPRLRPGVFIHVHDIFLPAEYPKHWVLEHRNVFTEQYLLQAFLAFNESFRVVLAASYLHLNRPEWLEASFSSYNRMSVVPGSFWFRREK